MNPFISPNKADNVTIAVAAEFCGKLSALGFRISGIHLNETLSGAEASYVPLSDFAAADLDPATKYNVIVSAGGDWHNVAKLIREWGAGTLQDFREVYDSIYRDGQANSAMLNIPGAAKAIERLIEKI